MSFEYMTLELQSIAKRVGGEHHIHPTSLVLEPGTINVLLGTTLAGKTTLMQLMAGLERPSSGKLLFAGNDVTGTAVQARNVSMVYQQFINYPNFSVFENIASPLRVGRISATEIKQRVGKVAELLQLSAMLDRKPAELSGGQQQRTAMARALVKDADLVLLDEPLANLDFKLREELRDELPRLFADRDCVVVYATTEPVEALLFGGHTATLFEGAVTQFGRSAAIYRNPNSLTSARVFSEPPVNQLKVSKRGSEIVAANGVAWKTGNAISALADGDYTFAIRPHNVTPQAQGDQPVAITADVKITELSGSESLIYFNLGEDHWISQCHGIHDFGPGTTASLHMDVSRGLYFDGAGNRVEA